MKDFTLWSIELLTNIYANVECKHRFNQKYMRTVSKKQIEKVVKSLNKNGDLHSVVGSVDAEMKASANITPKKTLKLLPITLNKPIQTTAKLTYK